MAETALRGRIHASLVPRDAHAAPELMAWAEFSPGHGGARNRFLFAKAAPHIPRHPRATAYPVLLDALGAVMPYALSYLEQAPRDDRHGLRSALTSLWVPVRPDGRPLALAQPAEADGPLALRIFAVPGAWLPLEALAAPLLSLAPADGWQVSGSLIWLGRLADLAAELWIRGDTLPVIERQRGYERTARWLPLLDDAGVRNRLEALARTLPFELHALSAPHDMQRRAADDWSTAADLVARFVDGLGRYRAGRGGQARRVQAPPRTWRLNHTQSDVWRAVGKALQCVPPDTLIQSAPLETVQERIDGWTAPARAALRPRFLQLVFRLDPPATATGIPAGTAAALLGATGEAPGMGRAEPAPWRLWAAVRTVGDRVDSVPVAALGQGGGAGDAAAQRLERDLPALRQWLGEELRRAARVLPALADALAQTPLPTGVDLSPAQLGRLMRQWGPRLRQQGFGLELPAWMEAAAARLRLHVRRRADLEPPAAGRIGLGAVTDLTAVVEAGGRTLTPEEVDAILSHGPGLFSMDGRAVEVDGEDLRLLARLVEAWRRAGSKGGLTLVDALTLLSEARARETGEDAEEDDTLIDPALLVGANEMLHRLVASVRAGLPAVEGLAEAPLGDAPVAAWLRPYQRDGVRWLWALADHGLGALLADDMGLGKTVETIGLIEARRGVGLLGATGEDAPETDGLRPCLLVCPTSVLTNWQRELARFAPGLRCYVHHGAARHRGDDALAAVAARADVVVTSYALLWRDLESLRAIAWDTVALDEAQAVKNASSQASRAARELQARVRIALTGTPVENRLEDLWAIFQFLNPGYLGSLDTFRRRFAQPVQAGHDMTRADVLRHLVAPFILRRLKSDPAVVRDLPPKVEIKETCSLTHEQGRLYEAVVRRLETELATAEGMRRRALIAVAMLRLKQILNHPAHFLAEDGPMRPQRSGKVVRILELVEESLAEGDRLLLFTQFTGFGARMAPLLSEVCRTEVPFLRGSTPRAMRDRMVGRFQAGEGSPILVLSLRAGGVGLNLTGANRVIHMDRWWNPAVEEQATDRAHRIGQTQRVIVHKMVTAGTLEDHIGAMLAGKRDLAEAVVGRGEGWLTELADDALLELLALRRDALEG